MDYISNLPLRIIETILCLLPIQEAARTSVLSKEWRYSWTKIPKLVFDEETFQLSVDEDELTVPEQLFDRISQTKDMPERCRLFYAIFQVLLCHDGTIQDFTLSMKADESCFEIDQILRHLSQTNSVKKLKLDLYSYSEYTLPSHFFSLTQLTYLYLRGCEIDLIPTFSGFGRLTTLFVEELKKSNIEKFLKLLFKSPLLKTATLNIGFDDVDYIGDSTIIDLFKCLPVIEHLSLWYGFLQCFQPSVELPQLVHLKYFCIEQMCFIEDDHIHMLVPMITSFPNLEKLKLEIYHNLFEDDPRGLFTTENYSDIRFEHLREFDIINVSWRKDEMEFVKLILAKSPVLKKVRILLCNGVQIEQISETLSLPTSIIGGRSNCGEWID